jgi:hypothetical protein
MPMRNRRDAEYRSLLSRQAGLLDFYTKTKVEINKAIMRIISISN